MNKIEQVALMIFCFLNSISALTNNTKYSINQSLIFKDEVQLKDYSAPQNVENLFYFYDIKFAYNRLKGLRQTFFEKLNKFDLKLNNNLTELDVFKNFEDFTTNYKYQVSCSICKKTFKTSHYLWIHATRSHLFEKYNETDMQNNIFWITTLSEFLDWDTKNYARIQDFELSKDVYYKFKKCLLFGKRYLDSNDIEKIYDFCLAFYFEKESKGKLQDFMTISFNFLFKALLVVFLIACLIYYSFAYYIYLDYSEYKLIKKKKEQEEDD